MYLPFVGRVRNDAANDAVKDAARKDAAHDSIKTLNKKSTSSVVDCYHSLTRTFDDQEIITKVLLELSRRFK